MLKRAAFHRNSVSTSRRTLLRPLARRSYFDCFFVWKTFGLELLKSIVFFQRKFAFHFLFIPRSVFRFFSRGCHNDDNKSTNCFQCVTKCAMRLSSSISLLCTCTLPSYPRRYLPAFRRRSAQCSSARRPSQLLALNHLFQDRKG